MVVKLQLHDLHRTGGVVGRLSGIRPPRARRNLRDRIPPDCHGADSNGHLRARSNAHRGRACAGLWFSRHVGTTLIVLAVLGAVAARTAARSAEPCQVESADHCIRVERDSSTGRILWLDNLEHSYVDLHKPAYLYFDYVKSFADTIAVAFPNHQESTRCTSAAAVSPSLDTSRSNIRGRRASCWRSTRRS